MKRWLLDSPSTDDLLSLLTAWRVWLGGAALGALIAAALYLLAPPPYRAQATVIVDHNVENVLGEERSDRDLNYYLQRETDKLVLLAYADDTLQPVAELSGLPLDVLRRDVLTLSQPGDGGWHFYADALTPEQARAWAAAWAQSFTARASAESSRAAAPNADNPAIISPYLALALTQSTDLPVQRAAPLGAYLLAGSLTGAAGLALAVLFAPRKETA